MSWVKSHIKCPWCASSDAFSVSLVRIKNKPAELHKCFSCGRAKVVSTKLLPRGRVKQKLKQPLPRGNADVLPEAAIEWLASFELGKRDILIRGMMWNNYFQRLLIPIRTKVGELVASQGRDIFGKTQMKWLTFGNPIPYYTPYNMNYKDRSPAIPDTLIIVEDMISAIKLDRYAPTVALLGTSLPKDKEAFIAQLPYKKAIVWLDSDSAGRVGAQKAIKTLQKYFRIRQIITDEDPKCIKHERLKELLSGYL